MRIAVSRHDRVGLNLAFTGLKLIKRIAACTDLSGIMNRRDFLRGEASFYTTVDGWMNGQRII